jgi:hypothetical protein
MVMHANTPRPTAACRSRSELWLIAVYAAVLLALVGSLGAGLALSGSFDSLVTSAGMQNMELAGR